ncbi:MAG: hypothetical protein KGI87_10060 [Burkholderiales bacterium]|nr:hypothetical protein [Burkholderiales bacterium]
MLSLKSTAAFAALLALGAVAASAAGHRRWRARTAALHRALAASRTPIRPTVFDPGELDGLPEPVQRYLRATLRAGQPLITGVRLWHRGRFNLSATGSTWRPFVSSQVVGTCRPGFGWDGRIRVAPGLHVFVHDAYVAGEGVLRAAVLGVVPLADQRGGAALAEGELMRYLAEAAWYPTALLPSQGLQWDDVDPDSARATLVDGATRVALVFRFGTDADGNTVISGVSAERRPRTVGGQVVATPWNGRFWAHALHHGMRIPVQGEVAWQLAAGPLPYWRGTLSRIEYDFAS